MAGPIHKEKNGIPAKALKVFSTVVADDLAMLASLHDKEPVEEFLQLLREDSFPDGLGLKLISENGKRAADLMKQGLASLPQPVDEATLDELAADYADIYLNHGIQASPQESVWIDEENLICQDTMFQVRAWYENHGLAAADWRTRPDDHLVLELQFLAHLFAADPSEDVLREAAQFMDEHLLRWLIDFGTRVGQKATTTYFAGVATLTSAYCDELRELLVNILHEPRPSREEIDERMAPTREREEVEVAFVPGMGPAV
jgi:TorA maturation chaperone TorD